MILCHTIGEMLRIRRRYGGVMLPTGRGEGALKPKRRASILVELPPDVSSGINREGGRQALKEQVTEMIYHILVVGVGAEPEPDLLPLLQLPTAPLQNLLGGRGRSTDPQQSPT